MPDHVIFFLGFPKVTKNYSYIQNFPVVKPYFQENMICPEMLKLVGVKRTKTWMQLRGTE